MSKKWSDSEKKKQQRRKVLPGFPWEGQFQTKEEIDAYFAGEKIQCLLCGKWFKQVSTSHLKRIHKMRADEYRNRYGLPWTRGVTSEHLREKRRKITKRRIAEGQLPVFDGDEQRSQKVRKNPRRAVQPFVRDLHRRHMHTVRGRTTIEDMQQLAESRGGKCLSKTYINNSTKLLWECKQGHQWEASPVNIKQGHWCPICAGNVPKTIKEMQHIARERGGKCLSETYSNNRTKLIWQCAKGHQWEATPKNVKRGSWCPYCAGTAKRTIEEMQHLARKRGGKCLSTSYASTATKLLWQCSEGHQWQATPYTVKRGAWCPMCAGNVKGTIEDMHQLAKRRGGKCLSTVYINTDTKLLWQCAKGHQWETTPHNIKSGHWCPLCAGNVKGTIEDMHQLAKRRGGKCLSTVYINTDTKLLWQCEQGHQWEATPDKIKQGKWCLTCAGKKRR